MLKISGSPNFLHADLFVGLINSGQGEVRNMALDGVNKLSFSFRYSILPIVYAGKTFHPHSGTGCDGPGDQSRLTALDCVKKSLSNTRKKAGYASPFSV